jgi:hypothetical protein
VLELLSETAAPAADGKLQMSHDRFLTCVACQGSKRRSLSTPRVSVSKGLQSDPHQAINEVAAPAKRQRPNDGHFSTNQLFELGVWNWNIPYPAVSTRTRKQTFSDEPK